MRVGGGGWGRLAGKEGWREEGREALMSYPNTTPAVLSDDHHHLTSTPFPRAWTAPRFPSSSSPLSIFPRRPPLSSPTHTRTPRVRV
jgi:hypothetical protein